MSQSKKASVIGRRRLMTGAAGGAAVALLSWGTSADQSVTPSPAPFPIRVQTPDLAFTPALETVRDQWAADSGAGDLILSIVPAEPTSDQLLNDARSGARRFSGALVASWSIPDLVRDNFILPATPPPAPLPDPIARLRSFGGVWVASDFDHDCGLLYFRKDVLDRFGLAPARMWVELQQQSAELAAELGGGVAVPLTHAQQAVDHFASMAASFVLAANPASSFWFEPERMEPALDSDAHRQALDVWDSLGQTAPSRVRDGSTGDLWQALVDGSVGYLVASADFLPYALERGLDPTVLGISPLPGVETDTGTVLRAGNTTGASWGGVVMRSASDRVGGVVRGFLDHLATPNALEPLWTDPSTSVIPAPPTDADAARTAASLVSAGWPEAVATQWVDSIKATLNNPVQLPALRIAETRRYLQALEDRMAPFLASDGGSATEVLALASEDWTAINDAIGLETQRDLYARSLMPAPQD